MLDRHRAALALLDGWSDGARHEIRATTRCEPDHDANGAVGNLGLGGGVLGQQAGADGQQERTA